jgi:hypothetical protein
VFGTDSTGTGEGGDSGSGVRQANELRALSALVFEDLRAFPGGIRDMHLGIAGSCVPGCGSGEPSGTGHPRHAFAPRL